MTAWQDVAPIRNMGAGQPRVQLIQPRTPAVSARGATLCHGRLNAGCPICRLRLTRTVDQGQGGFLDFRAISQRVHRSTGNAQVGFTGRRVLFGGRAC